MSTTTTKPAQKTILITGCSNAGLGSDLAKAFHAHGHRVLATARRTAKMSDLSALGIETFALDILSPSSLSACVAEVSTATAGAGIDILVNNAGVACPTMVLDADLDQARRCFETNYFGIIAVTQAFFPLVLEAQQRRGGTMVVNNTSIAALSALPTQGVYAASKAAAAVLSDIMRLEFRPFGVRVVELRTGSVKSSVFLNQKDGLDIELPASSLYNVAKGPVEAALRGEFSSKNQVDGAVWAEGVVGDLLREGSKQRQIWRGANAVLVWVGTFLPAWVFDGMYMDMGGMTEVEKALRQKRGVEGKKSV